MSLPATFNRRIVDAARKAVDSKSRVLYFVGTDERAKGRAAAAAFLHMAGTDAGNYLIRRHLLNRDLGDLTFGKGFLEVWGTKFLEAFEKKRQVAVGRGSHLYMDSTLSTSQHKTPFRRKTTMFLPSDGLIRDFNKKGKDAVAEELTYADRVILVSCMDTENDSWLDRHNPEVMVLNELDAEGHGRLFGLLPNFNPRWYGEGDIGRE